MLVRPEIHAQGKRLGPLPPLSLSVTFREHFLPYLLQIEMFRRDPGLRLIL